MKNTLYFLAFITIFIVFKLWYSFAETADLWFLLKPVSILITLFTSFSTVYDPEAGFYYSDPDILIDKSCSGFNLALLAFLIFAYHLKPSKIRYFIPMILFSVIGAYIFSVFVNSSRILIDLRANLIFSDLPLRSQGWIHEGIGVMTSLTCLIILYWSLERLMYVINPQTSLLKRKHENPA